MSTPSFNPFDFDDYNNSDPYDYDYDEAEETADILADPDTMAAIAEGESDFPARWHHERQAKNAELRAEVFGTAEEGDS